ncbi:PREDICTED: uncharacterized protein LOC108563301 [Nicrophorus vespilloides]|uniref:Uncharacterized protein LOC108563301 n=1 Tax=Nicrophorus vespilloides TaxID=110193 RepID=A0ABM1MS74_NICVS|nr:PREDICTED: uncharacterized protein LOC108563301 [Nicrophorus vespilloides]
MSEPETLTVDVPQSPSKIVSTVKTHGPGDATVISKTYVRLPLTTCRDTDGRKDSKRDLSFKEFDKTIIQQDHKPKLPAISSKAECFTPMPYMFRIPALQTAGAAPISLKTTKCPPFYIQLDHAIAVVWSLFSHEEYRKPLGINQLQWAYAFLDTIRDFKGKHSPDVEYCLDVISDELIAQYAELADDVQFIKESKDKKKVTSTPAKNASKGSNLQEESGTSWKTASTGSVKNEKSDVMVKRDVPFSINYMDMITRTPSNIQLDNSKSCKSCGAVGTEANASKSNMLNFLSEWRKDQVKKIHMELDRLHSIETYIGNANSGVEPYMDEKDKEMHVLLGEKMKRMQ